MGRGNDTIEHLRPDLNTTVCSGAAYQASAVVPPSQSNMELYFDTHQLEDADCNSILVRVNSLNQSEDHCTLISIQDPLCPTKETLGEAMR